MEDWLIKTYKKVTTFDQDLTRRGRRGFYFTEDKRSHNLTGLTPVKQKQPRVSLGMQDLHDIAPAIKYLSFVIPAKAGIQL